jgi:hypothetical protein
MGTGISKKFALALVVAIVAIASGCGGRSATSTSSTWLGPAASPAAWPSLTIGRGATISYPPGWRRVHGDPGTASAMLFGSGHRILGYLNLTPRQGAENELTWARFRVDHNREEGDRSVRTMRSGRDLRFLTGRGSCLQDSYATAAATRYIEIACLISGRRSTFVAVGATPPDQWPKMSPQIERAIEGVRG